MFRLLCWVHWRNFLAWLRGAWRDSPLIIGMLVALVVGYLGVGYWLFRVGLDYLYHFPLVGPLLTHRVLFLIFAFFFVMLVVSNLIIGYSTLFRNRETSWFLTLPIPPRHIYRWKYFEALTVSSWALIFLSAPLMLAYGRVREVGPAFFVEVAALYLPFVALPAVFGSAGAVLVARLFNSRAVKVLVILGGFAALAGIFFGLHPITDAEAAKHADIVSIDSVLQHTRASLNPYLPSGWVTRAILAWSDGLNRQGLFYFLLVLSNALMGMLLLFEVMGRGFHASWAASFATRARRAHMSAENRRIAARRVSLPERLLAPIRRSSPPTAALALKDFRLFWRDPAQWSQFLIFFGLLCIYVANLRNVVATFQTPFWETLISYLNLAASSLTLSTLTTRFVFPQFSLEGKRIWILGLAPFGLGKVLMQKFWMAFSITLVITTAMMITSSRTLHLAAWKIVFFTLATIVMDASLCGLAVGLGALFPNFKEENPSKIVSGFGGTLCLVASFIYIIFFIALVAAPDLLAVTESRYSFPRPLAWSLAGALSLIVLLFPLTSAHARVKRLEI